MNIAILGTGMVGQALAKGFAKHGYLVKVGTRNPMDEKVQAWVKAIPDCTADTFSAVAAWCDIAVLCTKWSGTQSAIQMAGADNLKGKIVIDATNPLKEGELELAIGHTDSAGESVQRWLPESHVVKAFNTVTAHLMVDPAFPGKVKPTMFIAGNDAHSKGVVTKILQQFGWEVVDIGDIKGSRLLEPMCIAYCRYAFAHNQWNIAFALLHK